MSGYGPTLPRHTLNVAGSVFLPKGFELTMNMAYIIRLPVNATVPNLFLPGTVPTSTSGAEPIPDLAFNCLAITCGKAQFASAVANFKSTIGGTKNAPGAVIPLLALPNNYELDEPTMTQDLSLQKTFTFKERFKFLLIRQVFNALNISNLTGARSRSI